MGRIGIALFAAILLVVGYWVFVVLIRMFIGTELPDPTELLPYRWRDLFPRRF
jgi:hypothetical protein